MGIMPLWSVPLLFLGVTQEMTHVTAAVTKQYSPFFLSCLSVPNSSHRPPQKYLVEPPLITCASEQHKCSCPGGCLWKVPELPGLWVLEWFLCRAVGYLPQHPSAFCQLKSKAALIEPRVTVITSGIVLTIYFLYALLPKGLLTSPKNPGEGQHCFILIHLTLLAQPLTKIPFLSVPKAPTHTNKSK